jgi:signal transduction histidine kinase
VRCRSLLAAIHSIVSTKDFGQMNTDEPHSKTDLTTEEDLRKLISEHEGKLMEIADLVAHVRHEINNPLTGIIGQAQLLLRTDLDEASRRRIETIEQLASRIRDIVARLRDVQRPRQPLEYDEDEQAESDAPPRH